jgi:hypothetical protein
MRYVSFLFSRLSVVLFSLLFLSQGVFALECDLIGSGFTNNTALNGTWTDTGTLYRGLPSWSKGSYYLAINPVAYDPALLYWIIDTTPTSSGGFPYYKAYVDATGYLGNYTRNVGGTPLEGTMTSACSGSTEEGEMLVATSTVDVIGNTTNFALAIIIAILSLFVIAFVYNQFSIRKRPWQK